ncbi:hypothetical protein [Acidovorax sp. FJL06]|uniref:hypothetical protein n=1 Tax=Acidovorax sp. FJL06 TaxID=2153365 RepID=UPI000F58656A|nr:hypothetical protein [Acidovorax sp. FJL06]RQO81616.1 hypothetical protein DBV10_12780 [Acidovorax sp. FJL06]
MQKQASRFMPPVAARPPLRWPARFLIAMVALALLGVLWVHPFAVGGSALALGGLVAALGRREALRLARLAQSRAGESICQFARSIDCRRVDTWVVRAVYEELQGSLSSAEPVPLRVTDHLQRDLRLDADDLDDLIVDMAQRARRCLAHTSANPLFGKVATVGELVEFLHVQPRLVGGN